VRSPTCSFSSEVSLASAAPLSYEAFLSSVRFLECIWAPREGSAWVLFSSTSGLPVFPIWLSHRAAHRFASRWRPSLEHAPISLSDFVDDWLCGFLPDEARIGVAVTSPATGLLVTQHRLWADLGASVQFLP